MSDEKTTPQAEGAPGEGQTTAPGTPTGPATGGAAPAKKELTEDEKAPRIAAAKARAAAKKAAAAKDDSGEPKPPWEEKPVPPSHEDASEDPDAVALAAELDEVVLAAGTFAGDVTLTVPRERIEEVCRVLKERRDFTFLVDLTAVDWPEREEGRFDVVYWLHRFRDSKRLRLVTVVPEDESLASVTPVWRTANFMEREVYDMFGIIFDGHPALERILTWEGFNGHPLRKDFPVEGIDTGAAIYPDVYPPGGGPLTEEEKGGAK